MLERGALGDECDLKQRIRCFLGIVYVVDPPSNIFYKYGIMLILKGGCSPFVPLYTPNVLSFSRGLCFYAYRRVTFQRNLRHLRIASLTLTASVVLSGRVVSENSRQQQLFVAGV